MEHAAFGAEVAEDESLPVFLHRTDWVIDLTELSSQPERYAGLRAAAVDGGFSHRLAHHPTARLATP